MQKDSDAGRGKTNMLDIYTTGYKWAKGAGYRQKKNIERQKTDLAR